MPRVLFLPGAAGDPAFWEPVTDRLPAAWDKLRLGWPGLGDQPHDPAVHGLDDLVSLTIARLTEPSHIVAQSMGGVVAARAAAWHPDVVRSLVLVATSGGIDLRRHGATDWRPEYRLEYPGAAAWITDRPPEEPDVLRAITAPTLLIWGDDDPLSPISVGRELEQLIPQAELRVVPGGTHGVASEQPDAAAALVSAHIATNF